MLYDNGENNFYIDTSYAVHKLSPQDPALAGPTLGNNTSLFFFFLQ